MRLLRSLQQSAVQVVCATQSLCIDNCSFQICANIKLRKILVRTEKKHFRKIIKCLLTHVVRKTNNVLKHLKHKHNVSFFQERLDRFLAKYAFMLSHIALVQGVGVYD